LRFTTAIRMNATFPFVLPSVALPTKPPVELIDAGLADNYGVHTTGRFLYTFRERISQNTPGVVVLQLRDTEREPAIHPRGEPSRFTRCSRRSAAMYEAMPQSRDFYVAEVDRYAHAWLDTDLRVMELQYIPAKRFEKASLNFHLTERAKATIRTALEH